MASAPKQDIPQLVSERKYQNALAEATTRLRDNNQGDRRQLLLWKGYCEFYLGDYRQACTTYDDLLREFGEDGNGDVHLCRAACVLLAGFGAEAKKYAELGPECNLKTRLLLFCSHMTDNEEELMKHHAKLSKEGVDGLLVSAFSK